MFAGGVYPHDEVSASVVAPDGTVTDGAENKTHRRSHDHRRASRKEALQWAAKIAVACRCPQEVREFASTRPWVTDRRASARSARCLTLPVSPSGSGTKAGRGAAEPQRRLPGPRSSFPPSVAGLDLGPRHDAVPTRYPEAGTCCPCLLTAARRAMAAATQADTTIRIQRIGVRLRAHVMHRQRVTRPATNTHAPPSRSTTRALTRRHSGDCQNRSCGLAFLRAFTCWRRAGSHSAHRAPPSRGIARPHPTQSFKSGTSPPRHAPAYNSAECAGGGVCALRYLKRVAGRDHTRSIHRGHPPPRDARSTPTPADHHSHAHDTCDTGTRTSPGRAARRSSCDERSSFQCCHTGHTDHHPA